MAKISTIYSFLMRYDETSTNWVKIADILTDPDMGGDPEQLDVTTMSVSAREYIDGVRANEKKTYTAPYDIEVYIALKKLEGKKVQYAEWYGGNEDESGYVTATGDNGKFSFYGYLTVYPTGGSVNGVRTMNINITPTSKISFASSRIADASINSLSISGVTLTPRFSSVIRSYDGTTTAATLCGTAGDITIGKANSSNTLAVTLNGTAVTMSTTANGSGNYPNNAVTDGIALSIGTNILNITSTGTASEGTDTATVVYTVAINRHSS